jgi:hypothetical protein
MKKTFVEAVEELNAASRDLFAVYYAPFKPYVKPYLDRFEAWLEKHGWFE